jgi:ketopantoate hydroxymethyltransferase
VNLQAAILQAFSDYRMEVESHQFPDEEHSRSMEDDKWQAFLERAAGRDPS